MGMQCVEFSIRHQRIYVRYVRVWNMRFPEFSDFSLLSLITVLNIALDRPHDYSKQHYNASRDQPTKAAKPRQKLTKRKYLFLLLP